VEVMQAAHTPMMPIEIREPPAMSISGQSSGLNIIIPMGRVTKKSFSEAGFRQPIPMINIVGRPILFWLIDNLDLQDDDRIYIAVPPHVNVGFNLAHRLETEYPDLTIKLTELQFETKGPLETLLIASHSVETARDNNKTLCLDCSTIYFKNILGLFRSCQPGHGCSYYFEAEGGANNFSFIRISGKSNNLRANANGNSPPSSSRKGIPDFPTILDVREKVAISRFANTGAYGFPSAAAVKRHCAAVIDENMMGAHGGIYYISGLISAMIKGGTTFHAIKAPEFACVSSPPQLKTFLRAVKAGEFPSKIKMRICFDLDNAMLVNRVDPASGDSKVSVNKANLEMAKQLKSQGHTIILWTSQTEEQNLPAGETTAAFANCISTHVVFMATVGITTLVAPILSTPRNLRTACTTPPITPTNTQLAHLQQPRPKVLSHFSLLKTQTNTYLQWMPLR
jgi:hypothetical protein